MTRNIKSKIRDYQNRMEDQHHGKQPLRITVERDISSVKLLGAILIAPAMLAGFFWAIFIIESEGLSPTSDFLNVLTGCILKLLSDGCTECLPDLGYILFCTVLGGPFALFISYKIWQGLKTKIILSDLRIIKKQPSGKEIQFFWNEIQKIRILSGHGVVQVIFTRKKGSVLLDNNNNKFCTLTLRNEKPVISSAAAYLILNKIESYGISIIGEIELLEEIVQTPHQTRQGPLRPFTPNTTA